MKLLLDSHALIWYVDQTQLLSLTSQSAISDPENELLLSAGSIWEIGVAQAIVEQVSIVSVDANLDAFGVTRIW
jgi:PIN domain nuclease of toxin-antitoxin system